MNKRFLLSILLATFTVVGWAQTGNEKKLSVTTQMFLHELAGDITFGRDTKKEQRKKLRAVDADLRKSFRDFDRLYATPDTIGGQVFIAAYIRLYDNSNTSDLEALGVEVQSKFGNELITSNIPVDKIQEVAALPNVKHINVSPLRKPTTHKAREITKVQDILTNSYNAQTLGINDVYDGTGVLLGVIDTGIDFQHIAFKDKDGNTRIKKAYVYNGSNATEYDSSTIANATTDDKTGDHGTHTSSTAGGSSVIVNGNEVTVTDDHANATYGGMAPGADLYLAGVKSLSSTYLDNAVQKIVEYADANNMPVVVSNSWGSQLGPHDGTGDVAEIYSSLFGDSHPNHIALFAASNDGGKSKDGEGGGYHVSGMSSKANPLSTILRSGTYVNTDAGYMYAGIIANAWAQNPAVKSKGLGLKIIVLNSHTGEELYSKEVTPDDNIVSTSLSIAGLGKYYSGTLYAYFDQVESDKTQVILYSSDGITSRSTSTEASHGYDTFYLSDYTLAIQVYPIDESKSSVVDVWGGNYSYFTNHLQTNGYTWTAGSDDMCVSDEATMPDAISIGAYVSANTWTDSNGVYHSMEDTYTLGDIAYFSSYATADQSPTGQFYPWITAPGARLIAGVNHNHTASVDDYSYYGDNFNSDLVVNNANYPYAEMEGTSMATPTAAGIVALWLQAAKDAGTTLTVNQMKHIMKETADTDTYTTGPNHTHFGNGKINALEGIHYILGTQTKPVIVAESNNLAFTGYATRTYTESINISGLNLDGDLNIAKTGDASFTYTINDVANPTTIAEANAINGVNMTVTWSPTAAGNPTGTITLSSANADDVVINLSGTAEAATPTIIVDNDNLELSADLDLNATQSIKVTGRFLTQAVSVTEIDQSNVFTVSAEALPYNNVNSEEGATLTVTFNASAVGTYTGSITLASDGAAPVTINLTGTATDNGHADSSYLNIAKYATISSVNNDNGWDTQYVTNLYNYSENTSDKVGWLTMPVYGAWSSVEKNPKAQKWMTFDVNSTAMDDMTWDPDSPFMGSSTYFTNVTSKAIGSNLTLIPNVVKQSGVFYVTNVSAVKLYGIGNDKTNDSYPAALKVYECSVDNGNLTASSATTASEISASKTTFILTADGLDKSKIYKVEASIYRGYMYEIGFQTPLDIPATPVMSTDITTGNVSITSAMGVSDSKVFTITGANLTDGITVELIDNNDPKVFSISKQSASNGQNNMPRRRGGEENILTLTKVEAEAGAGIVVNFQSASTGDYTATLRLSTTGVTDIDIPLYGSSVTPEFTVTPTELNFSNATLSETSTMTFNVSAEHLSGPITATLTDANNVFALDKSSISVEDATNGNGVDVTVSFTPTSKESCTGSITLSSTNADPQTVTLSGSATAGSFSRTIGSLSMSTMYLDFPVRIPYENDDLMGVYYVKDIQNNAVVLARLNNVVPANFGVIVHGNIGSTHVFQKTNETETPAYNNLLKGVTTATTTTVLKELYNCTNILVLDKSSSFIGFYNWNGSMPANLAFLPYSNGESSKGLSITFGENDEYEVATDINSFGMNDDHDAWYTLQGMKLLGRPSKGGIYLHQGKTVIIK